MQHEKIELSCPKKVSSIKLSFTALCDASAIKDCVFNNNKFVSLIEDVINRPPSLKDLFNAKWNESNILVSTSCASCW